MMGRWFILKQLVGSSRSRSYAGVGFRPGAKTGVASDEVVVRHIPEWEGGEELLTTMPHTLRLQKPEGQRRDEGEMMFVHIPGTAKKTETAQGINVFVDWGGHQDDKDFGDKRHLAVTLIKEENALVIYGDITKHGLRTKYSARVEFDSATTQNLSSTGIKTEVKDGGLMVTLPKINYNWGS